MRARATSVLLFLLLGWSASGAPAQGQITGVNIDPSGWIAQVTIYQMPTNGVFNFGHEATANHTFPAATNFLLSVTSQGFDDACNSTTIVRTVRGMLPMRFAFNQHTNVLSGITNLSVRNLTNGADATTYYVVLDDYVHAGDSNVTATIAGAWVTASAVVNIATNAMAATNSSSILYPRVIAHWSWPGFELVTNDLVTNRILAFNQHGRQGRPVRAVKVWSVDADGTTNTPVVVNSVTLVTNQGDRIPVQEYVVVTRSTNLANARPFTNYFQAFPWVGDAESVYNSGAPYLSESGNSFSRGRTYWRDTNNSYGASFCIIDATNGTASGTVKTNWDLTDPPAPFLAWGFAINAAWRSNTIWFGRSNLDNTHFYFTNGTYTLTNLFQVGEARETGRVWSVLQPHPNVNSNDVVIVDSSMGWFANKAFGPIKCFNLTFDADAAAGYIFQAQVKSLWLDRCLLKSAGSLWVQENGTNFYITRSSLYAYPREGGGNGLGIWRGNHIEATTNTGDTTIQTYSVFCGNINTNFSRFTINANNSVADFNKITAFNAWHQVSNTTVGVVTYGKYATWQSHTCGVAMVGNLIEGKKISTGAFGAHSITTVTSATNMVVWNNTLMGGEYLPFGIDANSWNLISIKNNIFQGIGFFPYENAGTQYTNAWAQLFSVSASGNLFGMPADRFVHESYGKGNVVSKYGFHGASSICVTNTNTTFIAFGTYAPKARTFVDNTEAEAGDYHPTNGSPAFGLVETLTLPYDLWGSPRYVGGPAGALEGTNTGYPPVGITGRIKRIWLRNFHH